MAIYVLVRASESARRRCTQSIQYITRSSDVGRRFHIGPPLSLTSIERGLSCNPSPAPRSQPWGKLSITRKRAPADLPPFIFQVLVTSFSIFSPENATSKGESPLLLNLPEMSRNARVEFYDKFQRELDEYDRDFMKKYGELNTTLIFVSVLPVSTSIVALIWFCRPVCSLWSHPFSLSTFRANSNQVSKE